MCSGMQSMNSCGSQNTTVQSAASQSTVIDVDHVDKSIPMSWYLLSRAEQLQKLAAADKAVDMLWFVHGLAFNLINSPLFRDAVDKIKAAPAYKPCHRTTLSTSHLAARNADANEFKIKRLFHVTEEMLLDDPLADPSRFGFTKMYSEDQWQQFSSDIDQSQLTIQDLSDIRAAPTALLHALISHDQWTLDK